MLKTVFDRKKWNTTMPDLDKVKRKTLMADDTQSFYVQDELLRAYERWGGSFGANVRDFFTIFELIEVKGWILFVGNYNPLEGTFVCFTTSKVYYLRFGYPKNHNTVALFVGEKDDKHISEKNYYITRSSVSDELMVTIDSSVKSSRTGIAKAVHSDDCVLSVIKLNVSCMDLDYEIELSCRKLDNHARVIENTFLCDKVENFFLNHESEKAIELYDAFVQEMYEEGVLSSDFEYVRIKIYSNLAFRGEVYVQNDVLQRVSFIDNDELWRLFADGSWDYSQGGDVICWRWEESIKKRELISTIRKGETEEEKHFQTMRYAYVIKKAEAYRRELFD